jgi:hypothetical protein
MPMKPTMNALRHAPTALAFALLVLPLRADDPAKPKRIDVPLPGAVGGEDDPHAQMAKVFVQIERDMREIDRLLSDASAGKTPGQAGGAARRKAAEAIEGIDQLLRRSEQRSQEVVQGIDRLFELADHPHGEGAT